MTNGSTRGGNAQSRKPEKPYEGFPLFAHAGSGQWAKKILGKRHYFGSWRNDPTGGKALEEFNRQWPYLKEGRTPPPAHISQDGCTVRDACNDFLESKHAKLQSEELSRATFSDYFRTCQMLAEHLGERRLDDLRPEDFRDYRTKLAKLYGVQRLKMEITRARMICKHAFDNDLIEKPVKFGSEFEKPSAKRLKKHENEQSPKLFSREETLRIIEAADVHLRAMIYLGLNGGLGNHDCASLPITAVDFENPWLEFPRVKTQIPRRIPLWPETLQALRESFERRPEPQSVEYAGLFFLTPTGVPWVRYFLADDKPGSLKNTVSVETRKLLKALGINGRKGLGFYTFRHMLETKGGETTDQVAVDAIMGHVDGSMAANYRHGISDKRLRAVVDTVRDWLLPAEGGAE